MSSESFTLETGSEINKSVTAIKLNLGCGGAWSVEGWLGIDQESTAGIWQRPEEHTFIDLDLKRGLPFPTNSVDVVFSSHTLEHFTYEEAIALLFEIYRVLKIGAPLCLVVPNMDLYISNYLARNHEFLTTPEIIGGQPKGNLADNFLMNFYSDPMFNNTCHKYAYNFENLSSTLRLVGFEQIERVGFHEFSYWPELEGAEFRSPIPNVERFSLSVQCRKLAFNPDFREHPAFREARKFAGFGRSEQELRQHLNAVIVLNEGLHANLAKATTEQQRLEEEKNRVEEEKTRAIQESQRFAESLRSVEAELQRLTAEKALLVDENNRISEESRQSQAEQKIQFEKLTSLESEILQLSEEIDRLQAGKEQDQERVNELRLTNSESLRAVQRALARVASNAGINALVHYVRYGSKDGRNPGPFFDRNWYLLTYPDVKKSGLDPFVHWMRFGRAEGREPGPDSRWRQADPRSRTGARAKPAPQPFDLADPAQVPVANETLRKIITLSASAASPELEPSVTRYSPLISILLPVYNTPHRFLKEALQSIQNQFYSAWELCVVDDGSTDPECANILREAAKNDSRIRLSFSSTNEGIARASQQALEMAKGEFVAFVDHDDMLAPNALSEAVSCLRQDPAIDFIYTDHATIDANGVVLGAGLKPAWSPELFLSTNYIVHFKVIRRSLVIETGGFTDAIHVAQDIGLTCKLSERDTKVHHLQKVLYYWRACHGSVSMGTSAKPAIETAAMQTYAESLERRGTKARLVWPDYFRRRHAGVYKLDFPDEPGSKAAIVVVLDQHHSDLNRFKTCLKSTMYEPVPEVHFISIDGDITESSDGRFHTHRALIQQDLDSVIESIDCDLLAFVSPTARTISSSWLKELAGYFSLSPRIGVVGGKVLDDRLHVRTGGLLLLDGIVPISGEEPDESDGYWFNNRIPSNVEAVSSRLMATPKRVYLEMGGIPFHEYGHAAGVYYGLKLRAAGYRCVYNPWSKIIDCGPESAPEDLRERLEAIFGEDSLKDRYYHPFFSWETPYAVR